MEKTTNIKAESDRLLQLVSFKINDEEFGVDISNVQEIMRMIPITKLPNLPDYVEGIINLRDKVIKVIDLRSRLNLTIQKVDKNTRIIIVEVNGKSTGFIVDSVNEVLRVSSRIMESSKEIDSSINSDFIEAIGKLKDRLLILLNLDNILSVDEPELVAV